MTKYMMARAWVHNFTDWKRKPFSDDDKDLYDLCAVKEKVGNPYVGYWWKGQWVFGVGFVGVFFPVTDTRPATEKEKLDLSRGMVGGTFIDSYKLDMTRFV